MKKLLPLFISALFLISFSSCTIAIEILDDLITGETSSTSGSNSDNQSACDDSDLPSGGCPSQLAAFLARLAKGSAGEILPCVVDPHLSEAGELVLQIVKEEIQL